ncbi:NTP transferase domain-containing protein [Kribbella sp. NBC_00662]|uniref:NTP transferase domain-containing protein n=1 Tax=Kribbella sp. NBC_00662 TaxID=2975969 RepID=UPI0032438EE3
MSLVLLAGGYNNRMRRTDRTLPKSLVALHDVPPVMILLTQRFIRDDVQVVVTCDAQAAETFRVLYPQVARSVKIVEDDFVGTGRALRMGVEAARSRWVLVANADTIVPVDLTAWYRDIDLVAPVHQLLVPRSVQNSMLIGVDPVSGAVRHWGEGTGQSPACRLQPASSTGVYLVNRSSWLAWQYSDGLSLESDILPEAVSGGLVHGTIAPSSMPVFDYGTTERLQELQDNGRLRHDLLAAAHLVPKGYRCPPPSYIYEPMAISSGRLLSAASGAPS